jgi:hypothetical protein
MKDNYSQEFNQYRKETLFDGIKATKAPIEEFKSTTKPTFVAKTDISILPKTTNVIELDSKHPAKVYLKQRGFNKSQLRRLLYTDCFKTSASAINEESCKNLRYNEPRIIIPFYDNEKNIKLLQGRSLDPNVNPKFKYFTIKQHEDVDKIFGLEELDETMTTYGVEGPLDSLFVTNCLAKCDADLEKLDVDVLIYDNEPRNPDIVRYMSKAIVHRRSIVIWPNSPDSKIDINDMILKGVTQTQLMKVIEARTFLRFLSLAKCKSKACSRNK